MIARETAARWPRGCLRRGRMTTGFESSPLSDLDISWPSCSRSFASRSRADSAMTVPGRNTAAAPISFSVGTSSGGITPPITVMMSGRPCSSSAFFSAGQQGEVAGGQRRDPDDVHVGVDRLLGDLLGCGEQRAHVDVEAHVGEGRDDDLLPAVVAVLAHLRDQDPRPAALGLLELVGRGAHLLHERVSRCGRLVPEHAADRTDHCLVPPVDLLQRVGDLADGGLGAGRVDGEGEQVAVERALAGPPLGGVGQRLERSGVRRRRCARRAVARAWPSAGGRRRRCRPGARRADPRRRAGRC